MTAVHYSLRIHFLYQIAIKKNTSVFDIVKEQMKCNVCLKARNLLKSLKRFFLVLYAAENGKKINN